MDKTVNLAIPFDFLLRAIAPSLQSRQCSPCRIYSWFKSIHLLKISRH
ncbi:hypothetical protein [Nodosilinea sp. PGN35]|nr:hypothetical protein [Nodosilinea sp. TSF1-S3]MDF0365653.1 hypothetical protein [Nodosilinea sp. TSF1-S3]